MKKSRPNVLTISGFDPTNGAGLTADVKTLERLKCHALSICTANTVQTEVFFGLCEWTNTEMLHLQLETMLKKYDFEYVKIGIIENWKILNSFIDLLLAEKPNLKIVLDPVLRSSSDFEFHDTSNRFNSEVFDSVLNKIYLLTPNYEEIANLYPNKNVSETIKHISEKTNLFLKGGHNPDDIGKDKLYMNDGKEFTMNPKLKNLSEKHGSGCVLSSAITANLALGFPLLKACFRGKRYTEKFLGSNKTLLGYHSV